MVRRPAAVHGSRRTPRYANVSSDRRGPRRQRLNSLRPRKALAHMDVPAVGARGHPRADQQPLRVAVAAVPEPVRHAATGRPHQLPRPSATSANMCCVPGRCPQRVDAVGPGEPGQPDAAAHGRPGRTHGPAAWVAAGRRGADQRRRHGPGSGPAGWGRPGAAR